MNMRLHRPWRSLMSLRFLSSSADSLQSNVTQVTRAAKDFSLDTLFASAGCNQTDKYTGAVTPPLLLSTTYERDENLELSRGFNYSRLGNPTRQLLEDALTEIEGGMESFAFSSGMQGAMAVFSSCPHAHVLLPDDLYHGVYVLLSEVFQEWGMSFEKVDMINHNKVKERLEILRAERNPKKVIMWIETPSNPTCKFADIEKLSTLARSIFTVPEQTMVIVDSTWATPYLLRPLALGADAVLHSTTKYISGHSDCLGGSITLGSTASAKALQNRLRHVHQIGGGVLSPFDSWLTLRGLRTLPVRMKQHCDNAMIMAEYLKGHKAVQQVHYPGLVSHPQNKLATLHMGGRYGGMLSFLVKGTEDTMTSNALNVRNFTLILHFTS